VLATMCHLISSVQSAIHNILFDLDMSSAGLTSLQFGESKEMSVNVIFISHWYRKCML